MLVMRARKFSPVQGRLGPCRHGLKASRQYQQRDKKMSHTVFLVNMRAMIILGQERANQAKPFRKAALAAPAA